MYMYGDRTHISLVRRRFDDMQQEECPQEEEHERRYLKTDVPPSPAVIEEEIVDVAYCLTKRSSAATHGDTRQ